MVQKVHDRPTELKGRWLLTFNDMVTLLFAFFVLIISMSRIEPAKTGGMAGSVRKVLGMQESPNERQARVIIPFALPIREEDIERVKQGEKTSSGKLLDRKTGLYQSLKRLKGFTVLTTVDGFSLTMEEPLLFAAGSAVVLPAGHHKLKSLAEVLQRTDVNIRVEGYAGDLTGAPGNIPSKWELSMARAIAIVKYFAGTGGVRPERLSAAGYADVKKIKAPSLAGRSGLMSRQVDIILQFADN